MLFLVTKSEAKKINFILEHKDFDEVQIYFALMVLQQVKFQTKGCNFISSLFILSEFEKQMF